MTMNTLILGLIVGIQVVAPGQDPDLQELARLQKVAAATPLDLEAIWRGGQAAREAQAWADCKPTPTDCNSTERDRRERIWEPFTEGRPCWAYSVPAGRWYYDYCHFKKIAAVPGRTQRQIESHYILVKEGGPGFDCEGFMVGRCLFRAMEETYRGHICPLQGTQYFAEVCADLAKWSESAAKDAVMPGDGDADRVASAKLLARIAREGECLGGNDAKLFQSAIAPAAAILESGREKLPDPPRKKGAVGAEKSVGKP
jgi:hypothetical protein